MNPTFSPVSSEVETRLRQIAAFVFDFACFWTHFNDSVWASMFFGNWSTFLEFFIGLGLFSCQPKTSRALGFPLSHFWPVRWVAFTMDCTFPVVR